MKNNLIYIDNCILQKDRRIRLPKSILTNLQILGTQVKFNIYLDTINKSIVLTPLGEKYEEKN